METLNNSKNINYNFIAVPTQLFILLDYRLKLVLTSLIQVSTALANSNGWFYYSKEDLKKLCGIKNDKTIIACLETFYRLNLLEVQARTFESNIGNRTANYYKINFNEIDKYNEYSVYECMNIPELQIAMLDYTSKDYQTTYTAATENNSSNEESIPEHTDVQDNVSEEIPSNDAENVSEGQETSNPDNAEEYTLSEVDEDEVLSNFFYDEVDDCPLTDDELREHEEWQKATIEKRMKEWKEPEDELSFLDDKVDEETELKQAESPIESIRVDNKVIETASVIPSVIYKVEKRETPKLNIDEKTIQACNDLVKRYKNFQCKNSNESAEMCVAASSYITKQYQNGKIYLEDKDRFIRELVNERFRKFPI